MSIEIKVPAAGESVTEAIIGEWIKKSGDYVERDEAVLVLETDKASMEVVAEASGKLEVKAEEGETVPVGTVIGVIDTNAAKPTGAPAGASAAPPKSPPPPVIPPPAPARSAPVQAAPQGGGAATEAQSPAVRRLVNEHGVDVSQIDGTGRGGRVTKGDVLQALDSAPQKSAKAPAPEVRRAPNRNGQEQRDERVPMTTIRKRIAERLVQAQQQAAILTTFNEVDMSRAMALRSEYKDQFEKKYGVKLGFMGLFVKACVEALRDFRAVNASLDGTDIVYHNYYNIGVAVSTPKGLMVPVIHDADKLSLAEIEMVIRDYAIKARDGKISIDDLSGGTFTISNGGVFGSLMSTPILNPPQTGILGMHKIEDRPVVIDKQIVIRPMMYLALSYDHRLIDGKESVSFLVRIKECIEDPQRILLEI